MTALEEYKKRCQDHPSQWLTGRVNYVLDAADAAIAELQRIIVAGRELYEGANLRIADAEAALAKAEEDCQAEIWLAQSKLAAVEEERRKWEWVARTMARDAEHWTPNGPDAWLDGILSRWAARLTGKEEK